MMSDTTVKDMFYLFIVILTIYPIIELLFKKHHWIVKVLISAFIIFFWVISFKYKWIIDREAAETKHKSDSFKAVLDTKDSILMVKTDSANLFLKRLYSIGVKDSESYPVIYNTKKFTNNIKHLETLNEY